MEIMVSPIVNERYGGREGSPTSTLSTTQSEVGSFLEWKSQVLNNFIICKSKRVQNVMLDYSHLPDSLQMLFVPTAGAFFVR